MESSKSDLMNDSIEFDNLRKEVWGRYIREQKFRELINSARQYYIESQITKDLKMQLYSGMYLGQAYILSDKPDSMLVYYNEILPIAEKLGYPAPLMAIYNGLGINALNSALNYNESLSYFQKALRIAYKINDMSNYACIISNMIWVYYLRNDTSGIKYAKEAYLLSEKLDLDYCRYFGALGMTYMSYIMGEYNSALKYVDEVSMFSQKFGLDRGYALKAKILSAMENDIEADEYFNLAFQNENEMDVTSSIDAYYSFGNHLLKKGAYGRSIEEYKKGLKISEESNNYFCILKLYKGLSEAYDKLGMPDSSIVYLKHSSEITDTLFNVEKERFFSSIQLKYEREEQENILKDKNLQIAQQRQNIQMVVFILTLAGVILIVLWVLYRRKSLMYRELVLRYNTFSKRERTLSDENDLLRKRIASINSKFATDCTPDEKDDSFHEHSEVGFDRKSEELFFRLEKLMKEDKIWKDKDLSIEKLVELLGVNRTYISRMLNGYAKTSFSNYVNSYRIKEAVAVLSDKSNDVPLKVLSDDLGYNSLSTFYRLFQKETGVPPSKFRKESANL